MPNKGANGGMRLATSDSLRLASGAQRSPTPGRPLYACKPAFTPTVLPRFPPPGSIFAARDRAEPNHQHTRILKSALGGMKRGGPAPSYLKKRSGASRIRQFGELVSWNHRYKQHS